MAEPKRPQRRLGEIDAIDPSKIAPSAHLEEFQAQLAAFLRAGGEPALVWRAIADLGGQISTVRHHVANVEQHTEILEFKLFGFPDEPGGGRLGDLFEKMEENRKSLEKTLIEQTSTMKASTDLSVKEIQSTLAWVMRIAGFVLLIVSGVAIALITGWIQHR